MVKMVWFVLFTILLTSGALATAIQDMIDDDVTGTVTIGPGDYQENVVVDKPLLLIGSDNPTLRPLDTTNSILKIADPDVQLLGFSLLGATIARSIEISNCSPTVTEGPFIIYNNIYGPAVGLYANNTCPVLAKYNYWGDEGEGAQRGAPFVEGNAHIVGSNVVYQPWLTAPVTKGMVDITSNTCFSLDNAAAGIKLYVPLCSYATEEIASGGTASFLYEPNITGILPGISLKYYTAYLEGLTDGIASVNVTFTDEEISDAHADVNSLRLYLWKGGFWIPSDDYHISDHVVSGVFNVEDLTGTNVAPVIALVSTGDLPANYNVTIEPKETPDVPIGQKPEPNITINSDALISSVYYQMDEYSSLEWSLIPSSQANINTWSYIKWAMPNSTWSSLAEGTHVVYFKFTRVDATDVGDSGEISWQFSKGNDTPPDTFRLISPNGGETLNRKPFRINWTGLDLDSASLIEIRWSGDGGSTYPYYIADLGPGSSSYSWRSPNIKTDLAKVRVTVKYSDGRQVSDESDGTFSVVNGYSFFAWKPTFGYTSFKMGTKPPYSFHIG